jgi:hypothetical protein
MNRAFLDQFGQPNNPRRLQLPISREMLNGINFQRHLDEKVEVMIPVRVEHADREIVGLVTNLNIGKEGLMIVLRPSKESTAFQEYAFICIWFSKNPTHNCGVLKP